LINEEKTLFFFQYQSMCAQLMRDYYDQRIKPLLLQLV